MKIIDRKVEVINPPLYENLLYQVETAGRTCYKSNKSEGSAERLITSLIKSGHMSVLEFGDIMFRITCDRATANQIVRHRLFSFAQQSTRYCNYSKNSFDNEIKFIEPIGLDEQSAIPWKNNCLICEQNYFELLGLGNKPEVARSVLNHSLATEICVKGNIREIRHFIELRSDRHAQADIREISNHMLEMLYNLYPIFFKDLYIKFIGE